MLLCLLAASGCAIGPDPAAGEADSDTGAALPAPAASSPQAPAGGARARPPHARTPQARTPQARTATPPTPSSQAPSAPAPSAEVPSASPTSDPNLPGLAPAPTGALVSRPLPGSGAVRGGLVPGFPTRVLPPVPDGTITASRVAAAGDRLRVGLTGTSASPSQDVLLHYRVALTGLRFVEQRKVPGAVEVRFRRGADTVTVRASDSAGGSSYSLRATLHAG